jgi:thiol-disulfide isomerase/thioredoxin
VQAAAKQSSPREQAKMKEAVDEAMARAWQIWALALEQLGDTAKAAGLAHQSFELVPSASASRIAARLFEKAGQKPEAIAAWAAAFAIDETERPADRAKMVGLYKSLKGTVAGAGDELLKAFDRLDAIEKRRAAEIRALDPNHGLENPMDFTLTGIKGDPLALKSLRGRVVVFDFWATWCGPCRQQYPLYQQVQERFKKNNKVVFLAVSTDEERAAVKPFIESMKWDKSVYFDEGLSSLLKVNSIPTTMVFNGKGDLVSRMNGFLPERFVDMLSDRILQALNE